MKKMMVLAGIGLLQLVACQLSYGSFDASGCYTACAVTNRDCLAKINSVNDIEIKDGQDACRAAKADCDKQCLDAYDNDVREQREKALQEHPEQAPQDGQEQPSPDQQEQPPQ